jgi:hypothetical protein
MLITFKSKAAAEVLMYATHAKPILDLLGKDAARGVITAEETGNAIRQVEAEIARRKQADAAQEAAAGDQDDDRESDATRADHVSFATRTFPLLEMLRAAHRDGEFVMWGV